jgi:hypothetical protein
LTILLDTVKDLSPEIAEITGIRQQAFEHGIDFVSNAYTGTIDLRWIEQGIQFTRAALAVCDMKVSLKPGAVTDESAYAAALMAQIASLAPPAPVSGSASVSYDRRTRTLTVMIGHKPWTIDVKQLAKDVAHQLALRRNRKFLLAALRPVMLVAVPGAGAYLAVCMICLDLVSDT